MADAAGGPRGALRARAACLLLAFAFLRRLLCRARVCGLADCGKACVAQEVSPRKGASCAPACEGRVSADQNKNGRMEPPKEEEQRAEDKVEALCVEIKDYEHKIEAFERKIEDYEREIKDYERKIEAEKAKAAGERDEAAIKGCRASIKGCRASIKGCRASIKRCDASIAMWHAKLQAERNVPVAEMAGLTLRPSGVHVCSLHPFMKIR